MNRRIDRVVDIAGKPDPAFISFPWTVVIGMCVEVRDPDLLGNLTRTFAGENDVGLQLQHGFEPFEFIWVVDGKRAFFASGNALFHVTLMAEFRIDRDNIDAHLFMNDMRPVPEFGSARPETYFFAFQTFLVPVEFRFPSGGFLVDDRLCSVLDSEEQADLSERIRQRFKTKSVDIKPRNPILTLSSLQMYSAERAHSSTLRCALCIALRSS